MILAPEELRRVAELKHRSPHDVLGMHPLADGSGVVVRAFWPGAIKVEVRFLEPKGAPGSELQNIHKAGVFEGTIPGVKLPCVYELIFTDDKGNTRALRDPYSFLPTLSDDDLYLFGKGDE